MTERRLPLNHDQIRGVLEGRTQLRAPVFKSGLDAHFKFNSITKGRAIFGLATKIKKLPLCPPLFGVGSPFGSVGDRFYVPETWTLGEVSSNGVSIIYKASNDIRPDGISYEEFGSGLWFKREQDELDKFRQEIEWLDVVGNGFNWKPSFSLPRWAVRIRLEVVGLNVIPWLDNIWTWACDIRKIDPIFG